MLRRVVWTSDRSRCSRVDFACACSRGDACSSMQSRRWPASSWASRRAIPMGRPRMRLIQHKKEAYWFYRFVSPIYDRWVNPLFWTPELRSAALALARLDDRHLRTLDVGAGTGFSTAGIVESVEAGAVTMLDQSPDQLRRASTKPELEDSRKLVGDAEALPFADDSFDRYVSCGSIEYWPDPARAIAEAHRVVRPGGTVLVVGPLPPRRRVARLVAGAPLRRGMPSRSPAAPARPGRLPRLQAPSRTCASHGRHGAYCASRPGRSPVRRSCRSASFCTYAPDAS